MVYASTREWSSLVCTVRYALSLKVVKRLLSLPARTSERLWENSCCLSSACIVVGAVTVTPAENFGFPLSESSPPRKHFFFFFKKKSVSPHDSLAVHPDRSERSPTLPSSSGLCVRQIENEQQSTVGGVSQPLKVMALARPLAGPDNAVPSLPGSDSWLSEKKQKKKKIRSLFLHVLVQSSYILDVVGTFWMLALVSRLWLCLTVHVHVSPVRSTHDQCTRQASDMTCDSDVIEKPSRRWRGAVQQLADFVWES